MDDRNAGSLSGRLTGARHNFLRFATLHFGNCVVISLIRNLGEIPTAHLLTFPEVNGIRFCGVSVVQMLADKISSISSEKVFRRIKDVVDLYYLSQVFNFDKTIVLCALKKSQRTLGDFNGFLHQTELLKHSYEKFRFAGNVSKPPFDEVYLTVKKFIKPILPRERNRDFER